MNIQLEKLELIKKLVETEDPTIIDSIKEIFSKKNKDWWDDLTDEQKEDIAQSELEFERGEFTSYEDVMKKYS
ncbi:hypothetical protein [Flavobacterium reichenbachii]|uniref:Addiction module protein n=1 Tax=Flavobacterium reichenbachii TaxID=362418 RepID=A0A085ZRM3_9FLAO|nr:hypothetical protein [Flavobacterium reichenbachii]KFF07087.1 hypothetical protein IW19_16900 [Flavobacterium reichenbachii]OXB13418.1 hypothetical protein B0A68_16855 [Flavobacterium reichenbachii]